jgi:hypothetical protein
MKLEYKCFICGELYSPFGKHLISVHNITSKDYYDKFMKKENEGKCKICGKETRFGRMCTGYSNYCSNKCRSLDKDIVKKRKATLKEIHGDENWVNMEAQYETNLKRYGNKFSCRSKNNLDKTEETLIKKYGTIKNSYIERNKKAEETNLEKYGYKHPAQSPDIDCTCHRIQYDEKNFDSKWEFLYYKYLKENNIDFIFHPKLKFEFEYDGEIHTYKPDFIVEGIITEVKGDHFFKDGKMICPWKYKNDTPEKTKWRNGLFEAKHQCMLNNGIKILKYNELHELKLV